MLLLPRNKFPYVAGSAIASNVTAFWPFGDAFDATVIADASGRGNNLTPYLRIGVTTYKFQFGSSRMSQNLNGAAKGWGRWNRLLTSAEKAALAAKEYWPFNSTTSLRDAKAYYLFDEPDNSATYVDATGRGNDLSPSGAITRTPGPGGSGDNASNFNDGPYLYRDNPGTDLQSGQFVTTVAGWIRINSKSANRSQQCMWTQLDNSTPKSGYNVYYDSTSDRFWLDNDGGDNVSLNKGTYMNAATFGAPLTGVWYLLITEYDKDGNQTSISINNGTKDVLPNILQPVPASLSIGVGSRFFLNPAGDFGTRKSGWDADIYGNVLGNSRVSQTITPDVSIGPRSKTVWGWIKADNTTNSQWIAGMTGDWNITLASNLLTFKFGAEEVTVSVPFADTTSPHLVVCWYDRPNNIIHIDLDHSKYTATANGPGTAQTVAGVYFMGGTSSSQFAGVLKGWGIANGIPSGADLDYLWNNGNGI